MKVALAIRGAPTFLEGTFTDQNNPKRQTADPYGAHRNWTYFSQVRSLSGRFIGTWPKRRARGHNSATEGAGQTLVASAQWDAEPEVGSLSL